MPRVLPPTSCLSLGSKPSLNGGAFTSMSVWNDPLASTGSAERMDEDEVIKSVREIEVKNALKHAGATAIVPPPTRHPSSVFLFGTASVTEGPFDNHRIYFYSCRREVHYEGSIVASTEIPLCPDVSRSPFSRSVIIRVQRRPLPQGIYFFFVARALPRGTSCATPTAVVTWKAVVGGCLPFAISYMGNPPKDWNIRVIGRHSAPNSDSKNDGNSCWIYVTPSLDAAIERQLFLSTDVEVLFSYYGQPVMYVCLSEDSTEGSATPNCHGSEIITTMHTPDPPRKEQLCKLSASKQETHARVFSTPNPSRCLADALASAADLMHYQGNEEPVLKKHTTRDPRRPSHPWTTTTLLRHLDHWAAQQRDFVTRTRYFQLKDVANDAATALVGLQEFSTAHSSTRAKGSWALSLLELHCELLLKIAGCHAVRAPFCGQAPQSIVQLLRLAAKESLFLISALLRVDAAADTIIPHCDGAAGDLRVCLDVLLGVMQLRALRHISMVTMVMDGRCNYSAQCRRFLQHQVRMTAERVVVAEQLLHSAGSPLTSLLAPSLLLAGLSAVEVNAWLPSNIPQRCRLMNAAISLFEDGQRIFGRPQRVPQCVLATLELIDGECGRAHRRTLRALHSRLEDRSTPLEVIEAPGASSEYVDFSLTGYSVRQVCSISTVDSLFGESSLLFQSLMSTDGLTISHRDGHT